MLGSELVSQFGLCRGHTTRHFIYLDVYDQFCVDSNLVWEMMVSFRWLKLRQHINCHIGYIWHSLTDYISSKHEELSKINLNDSIRNSLSNVKTAPTKLMERSQYRRATVSGDRSAVAQQISLVDKPLRLH
jgi:hypothetical protein